MQLHSVSVIPMKCSSSSSDSLDLIIDKEGPLGLSVYVGNEDAMNNVGFVLVENEINSIVNCAAEINLTSCCCAEYFKVGFWDGFGNNTTTLASAVYALDQLLSPRHWPWVGYCPRNVLVNCHTGHSRSVVVMAMYLCQKHPQKYSWQTALAHVMRCRKITEPPTAGMRQLGTKLLNELTQQHGADATLFSVIKPEISCE